MAEEQPCHSYVYRYMAIVNRVIAFTPEQDAALRLQSAKQGCSVSELVRRAVEAALKKAEERKC
ncbi:MAG: hypothetical protein WBF54_15345 [Terriglobales bacterium]